MKYLSYLFGALVIISFRVFAQQPAQSLRATTPPVEAPSVVAPSIAAQPIAPSCDPNYTGACIPDFNVVGDLDCKDIPERRFQSIGSDPHRLDRDRDGIACES